MPSFEKAFIDAWPNSIKYKDLELFSLDRIPVKKKFSGTIRLISTNSEWKQAVVLKVPKGKGKITIDSDTSGACEGFFLWESGFKDDIHHFEGTSNDLQLLVYNAWQCDDWMGNMYTNYWSHGAAMIIEVNGNTRRYRCNDGHPDDNFDDIIFEVTIDE